MERYMYALPRRVTVNTILRIFQYKLLFDILTKHCTDLEIRYSHFALFCIDQSECPIHLFHSCTKTNFLWMQLQHLLQNVLITPLITSQSIMVGFTYHEVN